MKKSCCSCSETWIIIFIQSYIFLEQNICKSCKTECKSCKTECKVSQNINNKTKHKNVVTKTLEDYAAVSKRLAKMEREMGGSALCHSKIALLLSSTPELSVS